ncbi:hypothetical protein EBB07_27225 [Paenibacillaceae bacterium]|nr:hypothetical protein EBB07_27225 [Paenibacillaceae bacterium]
MPQKEIEFEEKTFEQKEEEFREQHQIRKGELDLDHIEIIGVKGGLLESLLSIFEAVKAKDDEARLTLTYDPQFDEFAGIEPYLLAVTKVELDDSRVKAVTEEYGLKEFADDVAVVKISMKTINRNLEEEIGTGDYVFVKISGQWKFYRYQ